MSDLQKNYDDEIDLLYLIKKVWDGKWKIALFIIAGIFIAFGYNITKVKNYIATTEILPITTFEDDKYKLLNTIFEDEKYRLHNASLENGKFNVKMDRLNSIMDRYDSGEELSPAEQKEIELYGLITDTKLEVEEVSETDLLINNKKYNLSDQIFIYDQYLNSKFVNDNEEKESGKIILLLLIFLLLITRRRKIVIYLFQQVIVETI